MHSEYYIMTQDVANKLNKAKKEPRISAVEFNKQIQKTMKKH